MVQPLKPETTRRGHLPTKQALFDTIQDWVGVEPLNLEKCLKVRQALKTSKVVKFDPWDMLNNFCFHVYAVYTKCVIFPDLYHAMI